MSGQKSRNVEAVYPLSPLQRGLLFHSLAAPGRDPYFQQATCRLVGALEREAFSRAWQRLAERHPPLRTAFVWQDLEDPLQVVGRQVRVPFAEHDWRALDAAEQERRWGVLMEEDRGAGFNPSKAPLMRVCLVQTGDETHRLLWSFHHLLLDGWSMSRLLSELFALYNAFRAGEEPALETPRPFRDFITWLQTQDMDAAERFWRRELAGFTAPTPVPAERNGLGPVGAGRGEAELSLAPGVTAALQELARRERLTLGTLIQGAWALLLGRSAGENDVVFGLTVSGRSATLPGAELMIGPFLNTLPARVRLRDDLPLRGWLSLLQERLVEIRELEHSPLPQVQAWSDAPKGTALFETLVVIENYPLEASRRDASGLAVQDVRVAEGSHYPLMLVAAPGRQLFLKLNYDQARCDELAVSRLLGQLALLLDRFTSGPDRRVGDLPLLSPAEHHQVVSEWNSATADYRLDRCLHELVEAQVDRTPDAVAVVDEDGGRITYRELERRANVLARRLRALGVGPEVLVGVCLERSVQMPVALLAVLKAGGAYVPLDPSHPRERLEHVVADAAFPVLILQESLRDAVPTGGARILPLETGTEAPDSTDGERRPGGATPDGLAYVIYTSGSTGRPKGVAVPHRAINNRLLWMQSACPMGPDDRLLQKTPFTFDASIWEIFIPLFTGARLVMARPGGHQDSGYMVEAIQRHGVTVLQLVPSMMGVFLDEPGVEGCVTLRQLYCGGEALPGEVPERAFARLPIAGMRNLYGPTEAAIDAASQPCRPGGSDTIVPIGRSLPYLQVLLLDRSGFPVPIGIPGELHIGGVNLARGYQGQPALTAEKFIPHPFSELPGERLYKTGDLARYRGDGTIEFLGRRDHQIKIRGVRIELGEIEAALLQNPGVREAVVLVLGGPGDGRLTACFVPSRELAPTAAELRTFLQEKLPDTMIPAAFVQLPALPRLSNGKLDRASLPAAEEDGGAAPAAVQPRSLTETVLAELWREVLGREGVSVHDSFVAAGGHSLLATRLLSRLRQAFQVEVPLSSVLAADDLASLAREIEELRRGETRPAAPPLRPVSRDGELPLSFAQQRMWFLHQMDPDSPAYNVPLAVELTGGLDVRALRASLGEIVRRHEVLRTTFITVAGRPVQRIAGPEMPDLPVIDLDALPETAGELRRILKAEARRPFDLATGPLLRATLLHLGGGRHALLITLHHIASDGWSAGILVRELTSLYGAFAAGRPSPLPELELQYADFAAWQRSWLAGEGFARELRFWTGSLAGAPAVLQLPADRPRPAIPSSSGEREGVAVAEDLATSLARIARKQGATPFMVLLAAFKTLLFRYTGQEDLLVGTPTAGRNRLEVEGLIGIFVNTLVLRSGLAGSLPFTELLHRVRASALLAADHQDLPFELVVDEVRPERETSRAPLFQVMFALQNAPLPPVSLPDLRLALLDVHSATSKFDLILELVETPSRIFGAFEYSTDLFDRPTLERMARHFETLLSGIVAQPEALLQELPLLSPAELTQAVAARPRRAADPAPALHRLFEEQVRRNPDGIAARYQGEELSYGELNQRANRLAHRLRGLGVGMDTFVGLLSERCLDLVVGVLGILKAGGAYVPLDPSYPAERQEWMLADAGAGVLVAQRGLARDARTGGAVVILEEAVQPGGPETDLEEEIPAEAAAYVIYTSGSTGRPKGVVVSHSNVARLFTSTQAWFGFTAEEVWSLFHSYAFDFSVWELWGALLHGGRLVVVPYEVSRAPERFYELLEREGVTVLSQTPSAFRQLMRVEEEREATGLPALRWVVFGGEALEVQGLRRWFEMHGEDRPRLVNMYGITETTVHVTYRPLGAADAALPTAGSVIGEVIPDLGVYVLDAAGGPVPAGVHGEMYVGGSGVARGYLGRPELTAQRFVPDPFGGEPGARLYRSGDLARWRNGELEYQGRIDAQVKIRGFRIELGEIESVLASHPGVAEAVVVARQDGEREKRLVAYVVPALQAFPGVAGLRSHLRETLPDYMVPGAIVVLDRLPLTVNSKVDRRSLPTPDLDARASEAETAAPESPIEEMLAEIWRQVLEVERVSAGDDFFELGGHSLLATQVMSRIREVFGVELPLRAAFEAPALHELAARVAASLQAGEGAAAPAIVPVPRDGSLPLSFAQQRLWFLDQLSPGNVAFNIAGGVRLNGALDRLALAAAVSEVARRHEILRTTFPTLEGEPVQAVAPPSTVPLPWIDLSALPEPMRRERLLAIGETAARAPFDLARGPLLRLFLVAEGEDRYALLFILHHIVTDGWSMSILVREIATLYAAALGREAAPLPELPVQYGDFAAWQRRWLAGETLEAQLAYWRRQLTGAPAVLPLPTDRPRPDEQTFAGRSLPLAFRSLSLSALRQLALDNGATLFMVLLAGFQLLLRSLTGEDDIVVGTDVANRNRGEIERLIGFFINQLPLRVRSTGNPTFRELIGRVREVALGAYAHQDLPFEKMVDALKLDRQLRYSPVFQVKLFLLNIPNAALDLPGLKIAPLDLERGAANLDLTVALRESGDILTGWVNYRTDLFEAATVSRLLKSFEALLVRVLAAPDLPVDDLSRFISQSERTQLAMENRARQESNIQRFKQIRPKAVHVPQADVVRMETLHPDRDILLVVRPTVDDLDLADWARGNRELIEEKLQRHGAILFRGFAVEAPADFESFAQQICPVLYRENSEHVRENVSGSLYTPTPYPADQQLLWHNENSFNHRWPMKIMFCCMKAPEQGGETPIVDSREVYERIAPEIRESFEDNRIMYMRNYRQGLGLDWQTVFRTTDKAAVEERAREEHLDLEWKAGDSLCTRAVRPAVIRHPRTGSASWFNQAQHWHVSCLDPETRRSMEALFAEGDLPRNCYFGDGSVIPDESLREILDVYRELEVSVPWQKGDVMLVDNVLAAHGRNPFVGERKLLVAMGDMVAFDEI